MTGPFDADAIRAAAARLNLLVITPLGRSGSMLLQSLFDGHPEAVCFAEVGQHWRHWQTFTAAGQDITRWLDLHPEFHDGRDFGASDSDAGKAIRDWFPVRRPAFEAAFLQAWEATGGEQLTDGRRFFACLAIGLAAARKQPLRPLKYIVFQQHNHKAMASDAAAMMTDFPDLKILATCRHPIESALSFHTLLKRTGHATFRNFSRNVRGWSAACWRHLEIASSQMDAAANLRLIDLNSLHADPDAQIGRLCDWLGISDHDLLRQSTMFGIDWGGNSADGQPIPTFSANRAKMLYPGSVGQDGGLTLAEFRYAEWLTRSVCAAAGYADPDVDKRTGLTGFLTILFTEMEWFRADTIAHDQGVRKLARRLGAVEIALVLREVIALRRTRFRNYAALRLDNSSNQ